MNVPNKLTVFRMIVTPLFLLVLLWHSLPHHYLYALILFAVAAITDFADGHIARKQNIITKFGQLLDPVADKMLTTAAYLGLMSLGFCNVWIVMIVLTREFVVTSFRLLASFQNIVVPANIWGKIKTVSQMVSMVLILLLAEFQYISLIPQDFNLALLSNVLLWITTILTVVSGLQYVIKISKQVDITK